MKIERRHYNKETGEWKTTFIEQDGFLVFSTHTNVPVEKIKKENKKKDEDEKQAEKN